jgi:transcriptional regulator with XRE-family HTH domain
MKNIGTVIRKLRRNKDITQDELAKGAGVTKAYISLIEKGNRPNISSTIIGNIAKVLDVPVEILVFMQLDLDNVQPNKREAFQDIKPAVDALINEFFLNPKPKDK